jgi:hypothetical protein
MTGNDFMLSALDANADQQARIPKSQWNESKGELIDYPTRVVKHNDTVLKGVEWIVFMTQYLLVFITFVTTCACALGTTPVSLFNYILTAREPRIIRLGFVGLSVALIFACSAQASPSGRWTSPLVNARLASARHRHDIYCFQASAGMVHNTFDLIKTSNVYLLPVSSHDDQIIGAFTGLLEEERMHYRLNHAVNPQKMVALSNTGARGINQASVN